jgi:hypothetical protein
VFPIFFLKLIEYYPKFCFGGFYWSTDACAKQFHLQPLLCG